MATTIRQGAIEDFEALVAFDDVAKSSEQRRCQIENGLRDSEISVALVDGTPKGYALINYRFFGHPFVELLYVASEWRRIGIGSALIEHIQKHANGPKLFTSTNQSNEPMRALLHRLGFEESGIIHNLDPGDPELVFLTRLQ
jgi:ribosomal protein S18 acetylase RimI-like enzyme